MFGFPEMFYCNTYFNAIPVNQQYPTFWICQEPQEILPASSPNQTDESKNFYDYLKEELLNRKPTFTKKVWKMEEDNLLLSLYENGCTWEQISQQFPKTNSQICKRRFLKIKQKQPRWRKEDEQTIKRMKEQENKSWNQITEAVKSHTMKQIRERYDNYLRDGIKVQEWDIQEDLKIVQYVRNVGKKWKKLSNSMKSRTQIQLKNRYYGTLMPIERKIDRQIYQRKNR